MNDDEKRKLIKNLSGSREYVNQLFNMLKRDQRNHDQEIQLVTEAKQCINDALFELTGDEFYRKG